MRLTLAVAAIFFIPALIPALTQPPPTNPLTGRKLNVDQIKERFSA
jgi:hypothetical protein